MKLTAKIWNELYKPGQKVIYYPVRKADYTPDERFEPIVTETRSVAWDISSGYSLVSIFGRAGGVCTDHLAIIVEK